ncbi:MAG: hypothetical protein AAF441_12660 [Pseudomonadota bacterium]
MSPRALFAGRSGGFVLIVVLWGAALLAVIALTFTQNTRLEAKAAHNIVSNAQARSLAEAAVQIGLKDGIATLFQRKQSRAARIRTDGTPFACTLPGGALAQIQIWDEGGKIDLNTARGPLLERAFQGTGLALAQARRLAHAVIDYRDANTARVSGGPEETGYGQAGKPYGSKDWLFESIFELAQVPGMSPAIFDRLAPYLTVHSGSQGVDRRAAPLPLLALLSGEDRGADRSAYELPQQFTARSRQAAFTMRAAVHMPGGGRFVRLAAIRPVETYRYRYEFASWRRGPSLERDLAGVSATTLQPC